MQCSSTTRTPSGLPHRARRWRLGSDRTFNVDRHTSDEVSGASGDLRLRLPGGPPLAVGAYGTPPMAEGGSVMSFWEGLRCHHRPPSSAATAGAAYMLDDASSASICARAASNTAYSASSTRSEREVDRRRSIVGCEVRLHLRPLGLVFRLLGREVLADGGDVSRPIRLDLSPPVRRFGFRGVGALSEFIGLLLCRFRRLLDRRTQLVPRFARRGAGPILGFLRTLRRFGERRRRARKRSGQAHCQPIVRTRSETTRSRPTRSGRPPNKQNELATSKRSTRAAEGQSRCSSERQEEKTEIRPGRSR